MTERVIFSQQQQVERETVFLSSYTPNAEGDPDGTKDEPARTTSDVISLGEDFVKQAAELARARTPEAEKSYIDQIKEQLKIHEEQLHFFMTQRAKNLILVQAFQPQVSTEQVLATDFVASGLSDLLQHEEQSHSAMADKIKERVIPVAKKATGVKNGTGDYRNDDIPMLNIYAEAHHIMAGIARSKYENITDDEGIVISPTHHFAQTHMKEAIEPAVIEAHDAFDVRAKEVQEKKAIIAKRIMTVKAFINQGDATEYLVERVATLEDELKAQDDSLAAIEKEKDRVFGRLLRIYEEIQAGDVVSSHESEFADYTYAKAA